MKKISTSKIILFSGIVIAASSCKKEKDEVPTPVVPTTTTGTGYDIPTSYNFSNVDYSGQTVRLNMLDSISVYMKKGNNGVMLDATTMKNMYSNTGNPFGDASLDSSDKQLKNKTFSLDQSYFDGLFDSLAMVSQSGNQVGSNGVAGIVSSGTKKYLMDANGMEYNQLITKQLMGAVFYYQAVEGYLAGLPVDDNTTVEVGKGTKQEHHCDEAFGYFGIPSDFPANTSGIKFWGSYSNKLDAAIASNTGVMNAFLKLRAAISNKDNTTRDAQIIVVREQWERVVAGAVILELSEAKTNFADDAVRNHYLSEAVGFIKALKYNSNKKITDAQITSVLASLGTNFYTISSTNIDAAINEIKAVYGFDLTLF